ncbi:MAG: flagellar biosynthetic protein FliR [Melioribacteraceae bacterium]|nr:flagellar biosynthetic protein FliR [Melioribacteraceae bacterium]
MTEILITEFITGILIFMRIGAMVFTAPVLSNRAIPTIPKLAVSLLITYIVLHMVDDFAYNYEDGLIPLAIIGFKEMLTGIIMGFMLNFSFYAISYAGMLIGFDIGLGAAMGFDPASESNTNIIGQVFSTMAFLIFLLINGHHYVIRGLGYSFNIIPIGFYTVNKPVVDLLVNYAGGIFIIAVKIASPIMVSFFLMHIAAGIIARVSPQMNVFFVLQPLKMGLGFFLLVAVIPIYVYAFKEILNGYEEKLYQLIKAMSL